MGNVPQHIQRTAPTKFSIKGTLHLTIEGTEDPIELGEVEIPIEVGFGSKPAYTGVRGISVE